MKNDRKNISSMVIAIVCRFVCCDCDLLCAEILAAFIECIAGNGCECGQAWDKRLCTIAQ